MAKISDKQKLFIMEKALDLRLRQVPTDDRFCPVRCIEQDLMKTESDFDFWYSDDHTELQKRPEMLAFMAFSSQKAQLVARVGVVDAAYRGQPDDVFVLGHEIGHAKLHRRKATKAAIAMKCPVVLARHTLGSRYQYIQEEAWELEANLFAGCLLAPPTGITPLMTTKDVTRKYGCTTSVALRAIGDARLWRGRNGI